MIWKQRWVAMLVLGAALVLGAGAERAAACPNCRENLPSGKQQADGQSEATVAQGYAWSIYLLLAVPLVMVATLGCTAVVLVRKASARQARGN